MQRRNIRQARRRAFWHLHWAVLLVLAALAWAPPPATLAAGAGQAAAPDAICVDGGLSGRPFVGVNCLTTVATLEEAVEAVEPGGRVVVRAFTATDENNVLGMGTYRGDGLSRTVLAGTAEQPIVIEAEGFNPEGVFIRPIISGAVRVTGTWERTPGAEYTWQIPWEVTPGSFGHSACVDRIWVSRRAGKAELADFPLTRPLFNQGNDYPSDCAENTVAGQPITPQQVDAFPGSYEWLDQVLYVHLPGGEDPNEYTVEVPARHTMSPGRGSTGLIIRGFRVYHTINGIDLWHCGTSAADRCQATHNETSYNTHFGLQPGKYGLLAYNSGVLNTIQLIKITSDFAEIAYNQVGGQLAHGFKLNDVRECLVHDNVVSGNTIDIPPAGTQAGWRIIGTRDAVAGIYLKNGTQSCEVTDNFVLRNKIGIYLRNDGDTLTEGNLIQGNTVVYNEIGMAWRDAGMWQYNESTGNIFSWGTLFRWDDATGPLTDIRVAIGVDPSQ